MERKALCGCNNLKKKFGRQVVLAGCSLEVRPGEMVGLAGENGSGKTTLMQCLLGFTKPDEGEVHIQRPLGYCPQENILNPAYSVEEHFNFMRSIYQRNSSIDDDFILSLYKTLKLDVYQKTLIGRLSGGTYQKVKFATSILHRPELLLLDEPYDGFDWQVYLALWEILSDLKAMGTGILMISHLIFDKQYFDHIYTLENGLAERYFG